MGEGDNLNKESVAVDRVCGMAVDPATAEYRSVHEGITHYFCSAGCKANFDKDPKKYTAEAEAAG